MNMPDAIELTRFVENYLCVYGIDNHNYRVEFDDETDEWFSTTFPDNVINEEIVKDMMVRTGLSREELFGMEAETIDKYSRKFPFFKLDSLFQSKYSAECKYTNLAKMPGLGYIGTIDRYDVIDLRKRVIRKAMELERAMGEEDHPDAYPVGFKYSTEWIISFPQFRKLLTALFQVVNRYRELFVKAIKSGLNEEDAHEMNFLASSMDIRDVVNQDIPLFYGNVFKLRDVYRKENLKDFFSYVKIGRMGKTKYWRCEEFLNDTALAESYIKMFPEAFAGMRQYLMRTGNISCWFYWSDDIPDDVINAAKKDGELAPDWRGAKPVCIHSDEDDLDYCADRNNEHYFDEENDLYDLSPDDPETIKDLDDDNDDLYEYEGREDFDDIDEEDTFEHYVIEQETIAAKAEAEDFLGSSFLEPDEEWTVSDRDRLVHIYIEKKPEEEFNNTQYYDRIRAAIQPENKGGLPFPKRECVSDKLLLSNGTVFDRRSARENALAGGV